MSQLIPSERFKSLINQPFRYSFDFCRLSFYEGIGGSIQVLKGGQWEHAANIERESKSYLKAYCFVLGNRLSFSLSYSAIESSIAEHSITNINEAAQTPTNVNEA